MMKMHTFKKKLVFKTIFQLKKKVKNIYTPFLVIYDKFVSDKMHFYRKRGTKIDKVAKSGYISF